MNKLLILFLVLILNGCHNNNNKNKRPSDQVYGTTSLVIYSVKLVESERLRKLGKYEYWVTDSSVVGTWVLITDEKYNIGDHLEITVKQ